MSMKKKKRKSVFAVLFVIVLLLVIAATVTSNVIFSGDRVPKVAGYYLYLHEEADMEPDIPLNSLVIAKEAPQTSLSPGNKVLCYLADGNLALREIYQMTIDGDNQTIYYPGTVLEQGNDLTIPRTNIFAICNWSSKELYQFVRFSTSVTGLMVCLVVPCIILIIMLLVKIARSSKEELDEDDFLFDDEEDVAPVPVVVKKPVKKDPLFDPNRPPAADMSLEKKKSSISENFSEKPVNENSPYQKSVKERTMKFNTIQQEDIEQANREEKTNKPTPNGTQVFSSQEIEKSAKEPAKPARKVDPVVPPPAKAEPSHLAKPEDKTESKPEEVKTTTERSAAPNIDDVVNPSELRAAKSGQRINHKIAASGSIDDLIAALEKEKKKL